MEANSKQSGGTVLGSPAHQMLAAARYGIPDLPATHVPRPRLVAALESAQSVALVVVSAPAGTGKTSLLAEWLDSTHRNGSTGWITFEDNDTAFWDLFLGCLARMGIEGPSSPGDEASGAGLVRPRTEALAAAIAGLPEPATVVLDGLELVSLEVAHEIDFLLQHTLGRLRLVLAGRVDPVLPLYRYRLADTMREIRVADLAFTDDEAAALLRGSGAVLGSPAVHDLNERVKGWAAGLRFAARALAQAEDPDLAASAVVAQTGDINEYLIGEVLDAQTPTVRRFLLETSVADVLTPGLAEALAGPSAQRILGSLGKLNAFVEPLSQQPGCYRYYPFFRALLRAQLAYEAPQTLHDLHRRAARWFVEQGLPDQAIGHLVALGAWDEVAAQLLDRLGRLLLEGPGGPLGHWTRQLPTDVDQPSADAVRAALALANGDRTACAVELSRARNADPTRYPGGDAAVRALSILDAVRASVADPVETTGALVQKAEDALAEPATPAGPSQTAQGAVVALAKGITLLRRGELRLARRVLDSAAALDVAHEFPSFRAECLGYLAVIDALEGYLSRAIHAAEESVALAARGGAPAGRCPPAAHVALACTALDQYELRAARTHISAAAASPALTDDPFLSGLTEGVRAGLDRAAGRLHPALLRLGAAADRASATDPWLADRLRVEAARISVASGRTELALTSLRGVDQDDQPQVSVVAAAAYVGQGKHAAAQACLTRVRSAGGPLQARVNGLLVEADHEYRNQSPGRARVVLDRSLRLAAPEGLRRPFHESGPVVQRLLSDDSRLLVENRWLNHSGPAARGAAPEHRPGDSPDRGPEVVEPLTVKELEILHHLEELLTTEEIAEKMFVSVNTVRTHVRSILRKLGVNRRNAAIRKARELGVLQS